VTILSVLAVAVFMVALSVGWLPPRAVWLLVVVAFFAVYPRGRA
jgi:hypothetical protein